MILVDSDVLIAHLRGHSQATEWLERVRRESGSLAVSMVGITEIAGGMRAPEKRELMRLLTSLEIRPVTERIAWRAADFARTYRRSHSGIDVGDYLIAATAAIEGLGLATLNVKHFPMFPKLEAPFELSI
ncbi:type II toxin-antitoxin system VapC family toxin [Solicola gregarius]|uniref:Ribonuclease VapC n=1 Tax=Solicola gregarius TaxID=2908642 RepID=A0AA46TL88_9ACTN|nr:type II toxin-antitoxin system VapC family toxin [Solicola gregarius]UYM07351.1 type II toxin-antitoxin system VapC family toxin [Solicola gregarius]